MESTSLFPSPTLLASLSSSTSSTSRRKKPPVRWVAAAAGRSSGDYMGKLVDDNMIVLRIRIREIKMLETNGGESAPSDWMEWEKRYYQYYNEGVCQAVGLLQSYMMNTRPSLGLAFLALFSLSVPISTVMAMFQAIEIANQLFFCGLS